MLGFFSTRCCYRAAVLFAQLPALLFFCGVPLSAKSHYEEPPGHIEVVSNTQGARVLIDGIQVGRVPLRKPIAVAPGSYTVTLSAPGHMAHTETVDVESRRTVRVEADLLAFAGVLSLSSNVDGAFVRIGKRGLGETPIVDREIPAGRHAIVVEAEGYLPSTHTVTLRAGERYALSAVLVRDPALVVAVTPSAKGRSVSLPWTERRWLLWGVVGAAVAGGGAVLLATSGRTMEIREPSRLPGGVPDGIINL